MSCRTVWAHGKHQIAVRNALIELFEAPAIESNTVGREVLTRIFGTPDITFDKPIIGIASNPLLAPLMSPGAHPIVWETQNRMATSTSTVLDPITTAGQERLCDF